MITRQTIATVITTTAIAYSICSPTQAANLAAQAQAKPRDPVSNDVDRNLQNDVKAALGADSGLDGSYVAVASRSGTVTLSGVVRSAEQLARVLQTTMSVAGVRHIDNALEVEDPAALPRPVQGAR
jgi:osmotically-inducible protein OsmY